MAKKKAPKKETTVLPDESANAKKLRAKAGKILSDVDQAVIFKTHRAREVPSFERSELKFGPVLGVGGFSVVKEIRKVTLRSQTADTLMEGEASASAATPEQHDALMDDEHYDISTARELIASRCLRDGDARYAVKFLHPELSKLEQARGIIDLALEAKYLSALSHPNIIKMRGWATTDPLKSGFFVLLDRLYDTLRERIEKWQSRKKQAKGPLFGLWSNTDELKVLMLDRLLVAYDLASAFRYLHENKLVYRDVKPENIGFDVRGDVKLFDFGLMANLRPDLKCDDGMYKLSGLTGSFPYMAPEVAQCRHYNCSADVFSFGILLWEILSLKGAFGGNMTHADYHNRVSIFGERPPVNHHWPPLTREIMKEAWAENPRNRPDFKRVAVLIRADLNDLSHDNEVVNRTTYMMRRSLRSMRGASLRSAHGTHARGSSKNLQNEIHHGYSLDDAS